MVNIPTVVLVLLLLVELVVVVIWEMVVVMVVVVVVDLLDSEVVGTEVTFPVRVIAVVIP